MKVKALSRPSSTTTRSNLNDLRLHHRNLNPTHHPHSSAREYTRAVTAAKLTQMFAKPFLGSFERGHNDGVNITAIKPNHLAPLLSGGVDGEVKLWDLSSRKCVGKKSPAHTGLVTGLAFCRDDQGGFLSAGSDGLVRRWRLGETAGEKEEGEEEGKEGLVRTWRHGKASAITSLSHHWEKNVFATASTSTLDVWSYERSEPIQSHDPSTFGWGDDTITHLSFNPSETDIVCYTSSDRGVGLIDTRVSQPLSKTILSLKSNAIQWNPMEPMNFALANEDHNAYSFDMRKLNRPLKRYKGHVGPVLTLSFNPTGKEIVTGGYDRTLRFFPVTHGISRDTYHLKRMQIVRTVNYTMDAKYVVSGSDDSNIRLWKAKANDVIGQVAPRQERSIRYREALVKKYGHMDEVRRIKHSRPMPQYIKKRAELERIQKESRDRKQANRIKHSKPGTMQFEGEIAKVVVKKVD